MLTARDIMTTEVIGVQASETAWTALNRMLRAGVRALVVHRRNKEDAYGILTETDIVYKVVAAGKDPTKVKVQEIMTQPCIVVNPDLGVEYIARLFAQAHIHHAPVIQEKLLGIVSTSDILRQAELLMLPVP